MNYDINKDSYASYDDYDKISYNCISYLIENNEVIWKLLKYNDSDALEKPNLTASEKRQLIYPGMGDTTDYRVFLDMGQDDANTQEVSILRVSPKRLKPTSHIYGKVSILFEIYCHYKINHIDAGEYYSTRKDMVTKEIIKTFNGVYINGIGRIYMNAKQSYDDGVTSYGTIPWKGNWIVMSNYFD